MLKESGARVKTLSFETIVPRLEIAAWPRGSVHSKACLIWVVDGNLIFPARGGVHGGGGGVTAKGGSVASHKVGLTSRPPRARHDYREKRIDKGVVHVVQEKGRHLKVPQNIVGHPAARARRLIIGILSMALDKDAAGIYKWCNGAITIVKTAARSIFNHYG